MQTYIKKLIQSKIKNRLDKFIMEYTLYLFIFLFLNYIYIYIYIYYTHTFMVYILTHSSNFEDPIFTASVFMFEITHVKLFLKLLTARNIQVKHAILYFKKLNY